MFSDLSGKRWRFESSPSLCFRGSCCLSCFLCGFTVKALAMLGKEEVARNRSRGASQCCRCIHLDLEMEGSSWCSGVCTFLSYPGFGVPYFKTFFLKGTTMNLMKYKFIRFSPWLVKSPVPFLPFLTSCLPPFTPHLATAAPWPFVCPRSSDKSLLEPLACVV